MYRPATPLTALIALLAYTVMAERSAPVVRLGTLLTLPLTALVGLVATVGPTTTVLLTLAMAGARGLVRLGRWRRDSWRS